MEKHVLSKSTFIRGVQCLKSLYLNKKRPFLRDRMPKERLIVFQRGHKVGELAQELFPGGINMSPGLPAAFKKAIKTTQEKIKEEFPVIYEAAFQYEGVMIFLDILVHTGNGWHAYEVKSSGGISDTYLMDAALQYHVIKGSGLDISGISLVHINKEYILEDEVDPKGLFKIVDVTEEALSRQEYVTQQIISEKEALGLEHSPKIDVGPHCREPYDCDFIGHCWKNIPRPEKKDAAKQIDRSLISFNDSRTAFVKILPMRPAIPMYRGTHPYQEIAFGYSLGMDSGTISGLFGYDSNPMDSLGPSLIDDLDGICTVICFGQSFFLKNILPESIEVIDLRNIILEDSDFYTEMKDKSDLERLRLIFDLKTLTLPEYKSDALAEHYFLTEYGSKETQEKLKGYAQSWVSIIKAFYEFCKTI